MNLRGSIRPLQKRIVRRILVACLIFVWAVPVYAATREVVDRVVAVVENEIITWRELESKIQPYMASLDAITDPEAKKKRRTQILQQVLDIEIGDRVINKELSSQRGKLGVSEKEVEKAIQEVMRSNHLTRDQLQVALYGQGMTWADYEQKLREQIERARLIQMKVQGRVQITDDAVKRRCQESLAAREGSPEIRVCASHVLIGIPPDATAPQIEKLRLRAVRLQQELALGANFASYAMKYSDDKGAPDGSLGCFGHGEMVDAFERAAFALKVGEVSPVVKTEFGFHIIKVTDHQAAATAVATCDSDKMLEQARSALYQEEMERQMNAWISELRRKAFVEVKL